MINMVQRSDRRYKRGLERKRLAEYQASEITKNVAIMNKNKEIMRGSYFWEKKELHFNTVNMS